VRNDVILLKRTAGRIEEGLEEVESLLKKVSIYKFEGIPGNLGIN
jgi:hypothetical protein